MATHHLYRPFIPSKLLPTFRSFCLPAKFQPPPASSSLTSKSRTTNKASVPLLKEKWLESLSLPSDLASREIAGNNDWIVGVDPDASGAVALLKPHSCGVSAQVFDTPHLQVLIGKSFRKRLDARSIVQLLQSFGAPFGTIAYIEQSIPYPKDGKQGWWSGGFTYGLWIGILVASGFSVVPVASRVWKEHFNLWQRPSTKDDSRKVASGLFPSLESSLKRKKDHGRADALLIAAYGRGLNLHSDSTALAELEASSQ